MNELNDQSAFTRPDVEVTNRKGTENLLETVRHFPSMVESDRIRAVEARQEVEDPEVPIDRVPYASASDVGGSAVKGFRISTFETLP